MVFSLGDFSHRRVRRVLSFKNMFVETVDINLLFKFQVYILIITFIFYSPKLTRTVLVAMFNESHLSLSQRRLEM